MGDVDRVLPNLATLGNALLGAGAIFFILEGNKLFAVLLVVAGVSLDGLDGMLARRAGVGGSAFGRTADSLADGITFGIAPALLVAVHSYNAPQWAPYEGVAIAVAVLVATLAFVRLALFTVRSYQHPFFVGVPTPLMAISIVALVLLFDEPAMVATMPGLFLLGASLAAVAMVVPVRFPKVRRDSAIRLPMTITAASLVLAIVVLQAGPTAMSPLWWLAFASTVLASAGILTYYLYGPLTVEREQRRAEVVLDG